MRLNRRVDKNPVVQIFPITGLQWFTFHELKSPPSVNLSFSPQKNGVWHRFVIKPVRKFVEVRHEKDLDPLFQKRRDDLSGYLRTFSIVRGGKGFAKQKHGIRFQVVDDLAHPAQFFVEFSALHGGIFFPPVVGENPFADVGAEGLSRHKHAALHHKLSHTDASQKCRFSALVRAGDDREVLIVGIDLIADNFLFHA